MSASWQDVWAAHFGRYKDDDFSLWAVELDHSFRNCTDSEIASGVRWLASTWDGQRRPKLADLKRAMRERSAQNDDAINRGSDPNINEQKIGKIRSAMLMADSHATRWDMLCDPIGMNIEGVDQTTNVPECDALMRWATSTWKDFESVTDSIRSKISRDISEFIGSIVWEAKRKC